jgi:hypothetical protein
MMSQIPFIKIGIFFACDHSFVNDHEFASFDPCAVCRRLSGHACLFLGWRMDHVQSFVAVCFAYCILPTQQGSFVAPSVLFDETVAIFNLTETQPDVLAGTLEFVDKVSSTPVGSLFASVEVKDDHAGVVSLSTSPSGTFSPLFSYELDHVAPFLLSFLNFFNIF